MHTRKTVAIGMLGTTLDKGRGPDRWNRWRPSVSVCQQPDLVVDRYELLRDPAHSKLGDEVALRGTALSRLNGWNQCTVRSFVVASIRCD